MGKLLRQNRAAWKSALTNRLVECLTEYRSCFVVNADNISSKQMQLIRMALRGKAVILMGKNTRIRKCIQSHVAKDPQVEKLLAHVKDNVGFIFTNEDLVQIKTIVDTHRFGAPAKVGAIAPIDVCVPAQATDIPPEKTSFFQALQISTKITKGTVEILSEVHLIHRGNKVGASEAALLKLLNITPFFYKLEVKKVYDKGSCFDPFVLEITDEHLVNKFIKFSTETMAPASVGLGIPSPISAPLFTRLAFNQLLSLTIACCDTVESCWMEQAKPYKEILCNPEKLAAAAAAASVVESTSKAGASDAAASEPTKKDSDSDDDEDDEEGGMFDLFG